VNLKQITIVPPNGLNLTLGSVIYTSGAPAGYTIDTLDLDPSPRRLYVANLALVPGAVVAPGQLEGRTVRVAGTIVGGDAEAVRVARTTLLRALNDGSGELVAIRWATEGTVRELRGHLDGAVECSSTGSHFLVYEFAVVCPNPIAYSTTQSSGVWGDPLPILNVGTAAAWPELTVTPTGGSPVTVANSTTGESLTITGVAAGDEIVVVTEPGYENITVEGVPAFNLMSSTSRFPRLAAGQNTTTITGGTATATWYAGWGE
jgi:hypothetical protein